MKLQVLDVNVFRHLPLGGTYQTRADYLEIYFQLDKSSLFCLWMSRQHLTAVVAAVVVRFLRLKLVSICSPTENSKCQEFSLKVQEKGLRTNRLIE